MDFQDLVNVEEAPILPQGTYNAIVLEAQETEAANGKDIIELTFQLANNPGLSFADGMEVDGATVSLTIWLPTEEDKMEPSRFGRGTMYDVSLRRMKKTFVSLGLNVKDYSSLAQMCEAVKGRDCTIEISHRTADDGTTYEQVKKIL